MVHLILLIQFSNNPKTKRYYDFESISDAVKHICTLYEERLKKINQEVPYITYDIMHLYQYIDEVIGKYFFDKNNMISSYILVARLFDINRSM